MDAHEMGKKMQQRLGCPIPHAPNTHCAILAAGRNQVIVRGAKGDTMNRADVALAPQVGWGNPTIHHARPNQSLQVCNTMLFAIHDTLAGLQIDAVRLARF